MRSPRIPAVPVPDFAPVVATITDTATVLFGPVSLAILRDEAERAWWPRSVLLRRKARRLQKRIEAAHERLEARRG